MAFSGAGIVLTINLFLPLINYPTIAPLSLLMVLPISYFFQFMLVPRLKLELKNKESNSDSKN